MQTNEPSQPMPPISAASWWRAGTIACLLVMAFALATGVSMFEQFTAQVNQLQTKLKNVAQIKYISVLMDEQKTPALLITQDLQDGALQIQRLNKVAEGREESMQLWALSPDGKPHSLGVLSSTGKTLRLVANDKTLIDVPKLAISVENKGGAQQSNTPNLPYLFTGVVIQKAL